MNKLTSPPNGDEQKLKIFLKRILNIYDITEEQLDILFKKRQSDPFMIGYDKGQTEFFYSYDGVQWKTNSIFKDAEPVSAVPLPIRGSVWKSIKSLQFFLVTDFCNLATRNSKSNPPSIIYMDSTGYSQSIAVIEWFKEMTYYNSKIERKK